MAEFLSLPPEVRTLATFFAIDCRPTAILGVSCLDPHVDVDGEVLYLNDAFSRGVDTAERLADVREAIKRSETAGEGFEAWHGKTLEGRQWQTSVCGDHLIVVALDAEIQERGTINQNNTVLDKRKNDSADDTAPGTNNSWNPEMKKPVDWTQHDLPGLSPYVRFIRNFDWASTPLGPTESWPVLLRQYMVSIMSNPNPRLMVWGDEMTFVYNEACVPLFGEKHPDALGRHTSFIWAEAWNDIKPLLDSTYGGKTNEIHELHLAIERKGYVEETYWDSTLLPIFDEHGDPIGVYDELTEVTEKTTGDRRRNRLGALSQRMTAASTLPELWQGVLTSIGETTTDMPFGLLYEVIDESVGSEGAEAESESISAESWSASAAKCAKLVGTVGLSADHPALVETFALLEHIETGVGITQACLRAWKTRQSVYLSTDNDTLPSSLRAVVSGRGFDDPVKAALVSPIRSTTGSDILGILITGLNPRCAYDGEYEMYLQVSVDFIEKAAALISLPEEQKRAKKIADDINQALARQLRLTTLKAERSEAKFSRLAASAPTGMFMLDVEGRPLYVNDMYLEMLGHTDYDEYRKAPVSTDWKAQVHEDDYDLFNESWSQVTEQKVPITLEYRLKRPWKSIDKTTAQELSGETWLLATAFPEIEADGSISTIQGWLTDISHRKFSENILNQRLADALEQRRQTENFIDMTSHEMRNPLSAILQSADSIVSTLTPTDANAEGSNTETAMPSVMVEDIIDAAQTIILCAQHQKRIVDDILTLSKLDASLLVISPEAVQPPTLISKALKMYESEIERAGIDAHLCLEPTYEELGVDWVMLDPSRLLQVIINLMTNSIKFTQYSDVRKIKICLGASYQRPTGKHHGIDFVPPRQNRAPRTPLPTPSNERDRRDEIYLQFAVYDTGRGLDDEEMKVLFQRFQQASPKTYSQYGGSGLGLFISRELCELQGGQIGVASREGHTVFTFFVKARRWTPEGEENRIARPESNRFTSAAASPMAFSRRGSTVMQDLTNQMESHTLANGATIEEFKPISRKRSFTPTPTAKIPEVAPAAPEEKVQLHVLLVEDNLINQKVMSQQLRRSGCIVHIANHGLECLEFLEKSSFCSAETPLHLILLDLEMPTMDGLTCIKHIRERQQDGRINSHVPVIAVTANARSEQIQIALEAGMDQVVTKPFRIAELLPTMDALVGEVGQARRGG